LVEQYLPALVRAASAISADWAIWQSRPQEEVGSSLLAPIAGR
jgi:IclR family pca regulon transcriptional regulator